MLDNSGKQIYLVCRSKDMSNCKTSCSQYILLNRQWGSLHKLISTIEKRYRRNGHPEKN